MRTEQGKMEANFSRNDAAEQDASDAPRLDVIQLSLALFQLFRLAVQPKWRDQARDKDYLSVTQMGTKSGTKISQPRTCFDSQ